MAADLLVVSDDGLRVLRVWLLRRLVETRNDVAAPQHVVRDEQTPWPQKFDQPVEHRSVLPLVAVLKDQIERSGDLVQHPRRVADDDVDAIGKTRAREVVACDLRALLIDFHRDEHSAFRQHARHPDSRIADRGPNLEDACRSRRQREHSEQRPDFGVDEGQLVAFSGAGDVAQHRIALTIERCKVLLDGVRYDLTHNVSSPSQRNEETEDRFYMRRTKIIPTRGPASDSDRLIEDLIAAGVDIFRLNFSHGTHESQSATFKRVRAAAAGAGREVAVLQDLAGPKIRTGATPDGKPILVKTADKLRIVTGDQPCVPGVISTTFEGLAKAVKPGASLLIADGLVELRVESTDGKTIETTVLEGGLIGDHKGINAPGVPLPASAVTPKDASDLKLGVSLGVDMIGLSFVQTGDDLDAARQLLKDANKPELPLIAKLERPQ